ncbi:MAG: hypothetical protein ACE5Q3_00270 [Alphaproteobacteria bacterium]
MNRLLIALVAVLALTGALVGCGKEGPPEPPEESEFPRTYPSR